jgi:hypothetical protein
MPELGMSFQAPLSVPIPPPPTGGLRYFRFNPLREPKPQSGFGFANRRFFWQYLLLFFL